MKILLVDDEEKNLELLEALLGPENYQTIRASTGEEALKILGETRVDMLLLDVMLPGMSGIEVLKTIRKNEVLQTLPILLITALTDREHKIEGVKAGADDYISKPFDKTELLARVKASSQLSFLRRQIVEKEKFERIIEATNDGIIVTDINLGPLTVNKAARELLNIYAEPPKNILTHINEIFKGGKILKSMQGDIENYILERFETKEYNPLYISVAVHKIKNTSNEIIQFVFIFKNVTSEYLVDKLKYNFLSLISHKFMTPLTVMKSSLELLGTLIKDVSLLEFVNKISKSQEKLQNILNRLLRFIEMDKEDINEQISVDIIDSFVAKRAKNYHFKYVVNKTITVEDIPFWQGMLIEELIDNSFKYYSGSRLQIDLVINDRFIELSDNGPGIPQEERESIFNSFYQIDKDFTGQIPGMGLGLALVRKLVKIHNGNIELKGNANNGTSIKINIPKPSEQAVGEPQSQK